MHSHSGEMLEWLKRHAWKACIRQNRISGSNPDLSATVNGCIPEECGRFYASSASWLAGCCIKRPVYARGISAVVSRCKGLPARATGMRSASEHTLLEYYAAPFGFAPICGGFRLRKGAS